MRRSLSTEEHASLLLKNIRGPGRNVHVDQPQPVCNIFTHAVFLTEHVNSEAGTCKVNAAPDTKSFALGSRASQDQVAILPWAHHSRRLGDKF